MAETQPDLGSIVRVKIHPSIGIARVGDSPHWFVGPEVTNPEPPKDYDKEKGETPYRDANQAIKRQAARFRIYGYDADGKVVAELTTALVEQIDWTVHLANKKGSWYQFYIAMDLPEVVDFKVKLRNQDVTGADRRKLEINPDPVRLSARARNRAPSAPAPHKGAFGATTKEDVHLGHSWTDIDGRLLVLGAGGTAKSPTGGKLLVDGVEYPFGNSPDWFDDTADGPVTAKVKIKDRTFTADPAWVAIVPPCYAPGLVSWRTMYDCVTDVLIQAGRLTFPGTTDFWEDIYPVLQRMTQLQWVNEGFAATFGHGGPWDFNNPELIEKLAALPVPASGAVPAMDPHRQLRQLVLSHFRPSNISVREPRGWPWLYDDTFWSKWPTSPRSFLTLSPVREAHFRRWVEGTFTSTRRNPPRCFDHVDLQEQPAMLDRAALHFCIADAFHAGYELPWIMRRPTLYESPYRIRHRTADEPEPAASLTQADALRVDGPTYALGPGELTRWMPVPWSGDAAWCRSGYGKELGPSLPTYWPSRLPNHVLSEADYTIVMTRDNPLPVRLAAFHRREKWYREAVFKPGDDDDVQMKAMMDNWTSMGIIEKRPGPGDALFPAEMYVETVPNAAALRPKPALSPVPAPPLQPQKK